MSFEEKRKAYAKMTEDAIHGYLSEKRIPEKLREAMTYSIDAGGKRLRPCLMLAACELACGDPAPALPFAAAIEMIHTYSLIHDDLPAMDNDDLRRGKPTNHVVFGEGIAVLAGDGLLNYAHQIIISAVFKAEKPYNALMAAKEISERAGVWGMIAGQTADLENEKNPTKDEQTLYYIHAHKTADMILSSLRAGAFAGNADQKTIDAFTEYAENLGLAFQIQDDLLDIFGDVKKLGKSIGKDAKVDKLTFPAVYGVERSREMQQACCDKAIAALDSIDADTSFFAEMVKKLAVRES